MQTGKRKLDSGSEETPAKKAKIEQEELVLVEPKHIEYPAAFIDRIYDDVIDALQWACDGLGKNQDLCRLIASFIDPHERIERQRIRGYIRQHQPHYAKRYNSVDDSCCLPSLVNLASKEAKTLALHPGQTSCDKSWWVTEDWDGDDEWYCFFCEQYLFTDTPGFSDVDLMECAGCYSFFCQDCVSKLSYYGEEGPSGPLGKRIPWDQVDIDEEEFCPLCSYGSRSREALHMEWIAARDRALSLPMS